MIFVGGAEYFSSRIKMVKLLRLILCMIVVLSSLKMAAQEVVVRNDTIYSWGNKKGVGPRFGVAKDTLFWIINRPRDNWFFSPRVGIQEYIGNAQKLKNCINVPTPVMQLSIGKWFIPDVSFELSFSYSRALSQSRYSLCPYIDFTGIPVEDGYYPYQKFAFNHSFWDGCLTLDLTNFFKGYYEGNRSHYHLMGSAGLGIGYGWGKVDNPRSSQDRKYAHNNELMGFIAFNHRYRLWEHIDFNVVFKFAGIRGSYDDFYGVDDHISAHNYWSRFDFVPSVCAGITINIGHNDVLHTFIETRHQDIFASNLQTMGDSSSNYYHDSSLMRIVQRAMDALRDRDSIIAVMQEQQSIQQPVAYYILYYPNGLDDDSLIVNPQFAQSYMKHFPNGDTLGGDSLHPNFIPGMPYILYYGPDSLNHMVNGGTYYPTGYDLASLKDRLSKNKSIIYCFIDQNREDSVLRGEMDDNQPYMVYYPNGKPGEPAGEDAKPNIVFYPNGTPYGIDSVTGKPLGDVQFVSYYPVDETDTSDLLADGNRKEHPWEQPGDYPEKRPDEPWEEDLSGKSLPELVLSEVERRNMKAVYVTYELNKAEVKPWDREKLREMAAYINADTSDSKYMVMGSADSRTGTPTINQRLSEMRCKTVYDILVNEFNVDPKRLIKKALGGIDDYEPYIMNRLCIVVVNDPRWKYLIDLKQKQK